MAVQNLGPKYKPILLAYSEIQVAPFVSFIYSKCILVGSSISYEKLYPVQKRSFGVMVRPRGQP